MRSGLSGLLTNRERRAGAVRDLPAGPGTPTLPIWIFDNLFRPNAAPVVNVVAVVLVLVSIVPVWLATRLAGSSAADSHP